MANRTCANVTDQFRFEGTPENKQRKAVQQQEAPQVRFANEAWAELLPLVWNDI